MFCIRILLLTKSKTALHPSISCKYHRMTRYSVSYPDQPHAIKLYHLRCPHSWSNSKTLVVSYMEYKWHLLYVVDVRCFMHYCQ